MKPLAMAGLLPHRAIGTAADILVEDEKLRTALRRMCGVEIMNGETRHAKNAKVTTEK